MSLDSIKAPDAITDIRCFPFLINPTSSSFFGYFVFTDFFPDHLE